MLERERELAKLGAATKEAKSGAGSVVLIVGEAGIGKSSLVEAIRSVLPAEGRLLVGYCDDLATPRSSARCAISSAASGTGLTEALATGDRGRVIDALRAELDWAENPTVLVVEDVLSGRRGRVRRGGYASRQAAAAARDALLDQSREGCGPRRTRRDHDQSAAHHLRAHHHGGAAEDEGQPAHHRLGRHDRTTAAGPRRRQAEERLEAGRPVGGLRLPGTRTPNPRIKSTLLSMLDCPHSADRSI